jgi:hypothetical protein
MRRLVLGADMKRRNFIALDMVRRLVLITSLTAAIVYFGLVVNSLLGAGGLVGMSPDTPNYLLPAATQIFEGHWTHAQRPFGYPAIVYLSLWIGDSLNMVVAFQLALYVLSGWLVYLAVLISFRSCSQANVSTVIAPVFALGGMVGYFVLSSDLLAFAFYVLPESLTATSALAAFTSCLALVVKPNHRPACAMALAVAAAFCAALLISLKPSMTITAALTLLLAAWSLQHQRYLTRSYIITTLISMVALPIAVLITDRYLVRKYNDVRVTQFGVLNMFCNNVPLIIDSLETPSKHGHRLLGKEGSREVTEFLRDTIRAEIDTSKFRIQGFDGNYCLWYFEERRLGLERKYFGTAPDEVLRTYQRIVLASLLDAPGGYAFRFVRQMKAYLLGDQVACNRNQRWADRSFVTYPLVEKLVGYSVHSDSRTLPLAPGANTLCKRLAPFRSQLPIFSMAILLAGVFLGICWRRLPSDTGMQAVLLSIAFWVSGAMIVALVATFDEKRFVTVMFPVFVVMCAIGACSLAIGLVHGFMSGWQTVRWSSVGTAVTGEKPSGPPVQGPGQVRTGDQPQDR